MKKVVLLILDGWGISSDPYVSAIDSANTPNMNYYFKNYPNTNLSASGLEVGLPKGQMGNSEVGHMNLGSGRIVYQNLEKINLAIKDKTFGKEKVLKNFFEFAKKQNKKVHLIGLVSDGGVHSHIDHLKALIDLTQEFELKNVYIHAFTDGRDCDPKSGKKFITQIIKKIKNTSVQLASICGRYYAMDRDRRWDRIKVAYDMMVNQIGVYSKNPIQSIEEFYNQGITDEFLKPIIVSINENKISKIEDKDLVFCFNFRTDRGREITEALSQRDFFDFKMKKLNLYYITMTEYDRSFQNVQVVYPESLIINTLGEVLELNQKTQIRIAETEKYPHVTFFFSGRRETKYKGEQRILCQSPKDILTYDLKPEMAAFDIKKEAIKAINKNLPDFICVNFANADMVGHTGIMKAAIQACEIVDKCLGEIVQIAISKFYTVFILGDHGNSDLMINSDGTPNTQHTTNPVPFIVIDNLKKHKVIPGKLSDIAPSILNIMGITIPKEMDGEIIVN